MDLTVIREKHNLRENLKKKHILTNIKEQCIGRDPVTLLTCSNGTVWVRSESSELVVVPRCTTMLDDRNVLDRRCSIAKADVKPFKFNIIMLPVLYLPYYMYVLFAQFPLLLYNVSVVICRTKAFSFGQLALRSQMVNNFQWSGN